MGTEPDQYSEGNDALPELRWMGCEAWAWWNACQGIFGCSVRWSRKECEELTAPDYAGSGAIIVPVRVFVEPRDDWGFREQREKERG